MTPERFAAVKSLFAAVADLPPAERAGELRRMSSDEELVAEVLALHAAATATTSVSSTHAAVATALASVVSRQPAAGDTLGVWRIEREIGRGGMGSVFLAERSDGHFRQRAALKLLRGLPHSKTLKRFARERQLLATLTHPNIARLLDGGATPQGQPYLVMEYVDGADIDEHCRRHRLGVRAVLALFLTACDAVAFAHRQLVVHCDLKPSNLLIDREGRPVLLDFGIARLLDQVGAESASSETDGLILMASTAFTPRYASPEQYARGAVTTASDIYSLGVLLGELLEQASDRASFGTLRKRELEAIVLCATRQDPAERYPTVSSLTADIRRFLAQQPVRALEGGTGYALRKLLVRRWPWAAIAAAFALTVAAFTYNTVQERNRARQAEASARQISELLVSVFANGNLTAESGDIPASRLIAQAEARLAGELKGQGAVQAELYSTFGRVQANMGRLAEARTSYRRAIELERRQGRPLVLARMLGQLAALSRSMSDISEAEGLAREALELCRRHARPGSLAVAESLGTLGIILSEKLEIDEAGPLLRRALAIHERLDPEGPRTAETLYVLARHEQRAGHLGTSFVLLRRSLGLHAKLYGDKHPAYLEVLEHYGRQLRAAGHELAAEKCLRYVLAQRRVADVHARKLTPAN